MAKRYYWLKLDENFFEDDTIQWLEEQEGGIYYVNFYLKLCLKALSSDGVLIRLVGDMYIPYDAKKLAEMTRTDIDTVRVAMELFKKIGLIQILENGELYLTQLKEMVGSEAESAKRMRAKRARAKLENGAPKAIPSQCANNVQKCDTEIDIEIDIEKEKEREIEIEEKPRARSSRFVPPTLEEVQAYCYERQNQVDAERFIDYYTSNGWMVGKNKMKDWKASIRTWEKSSSYAKPKPEASSNPFLDIVREEF